MRWSSHLALSATLALEAAGLTMAAVWAHGQPTYLCDEGIRRPSGWIFAGIVLFALGLSTVVFWRTIFLDDNPALQRIYVVLTLAGTIAAVLIALYLDGKYSHYHCG